MESNITPDFEDDSFWGPREPVSVDVSSGLMMAGEATRPINLSGDLSLALSSYLSMVYELRSMSTGVIPLRNDDIEALADAFEMEQTDVAERLARLMHCDDLQTRRFVQMVKKGRVLVPVSMVAAGALLAVTLSFSGPSSTGLAHVNAQSQNPVETSVSTTLAPAVAQVEIGEAAQVEASAPQEAVQEESSTEGNNPAPDVAPGEVEIGDGISVTRGDGNGE